MIYENGKIFIVLSKNKNIISKIRRSKVTDYAALKWDRWKRAAL